MSHEERNELVLGAPVNSRLIEAYERYPQAQGSILQVLSVVYQPINQTTLQEILERLGWCAPDGTHLAEIMAKPLREQFLADDLITHEKNLLQCHPDMVEVLTRKAAAAGIAVPLKAKEQVLESVAAIAPLLTIHSEIGAGGGAEVDSVAADPTPHIHLRPAGEGLALECYIRPGQSHLN